MGEPVAWSYTRRPQDTPRDAVRFLVGQTSTSDTALLYDPEIDYLLAQFPNVFLAAANAAEQLAGLYNRVANSKRVGTLSLEFTNRVRDLMGTATALRRNAVLRTGTAFLGGQSYAARVTESANADQVQPNFQVGMDDNHFVGNPAPVPFGSS